MAQSSGGTSKNADFQARLHYVDGFKTFENIQNIKLPSSLVRSKSTKRIRKAMESLEICILISSDFCLSFFLSRSASPWTRVFCLCLMAWHPLTSVFSTMLCRLSTSMVGPLFCEMLKGPSQILNTRLAYISGFHNYFSYIVVTEFFFQKYTKLINHKVLVLSNFHRGNYDANTQTKSNILLCFRGIMIYLHSCHVDCFPLSSLISYN